jgi:hypothetical protein
MLGATRALEPIAHVAQHGSSSARQLAQHRQTTTWPTLSAASCGNPSVSDPRQESLSDCLGEPTAC